MVVFKSVRAELLVTILAGALSGGLLSSMLTHWWWEPQRTESQWKREALEKLISPVVTNLRRSETAYERYKKSGFQFGHARWLHSSNQQTRKILLSQSHLTPSTLVDDASCLIAHYDAWINRYDDVLQHETSNPRPSTEFRISLADLDLGECSEFPDGSADAFYQHARQLRVELNLP